MALRITPCLFIARSSGEGGPTTARGHFTCDQQDVHSIDLYPLDIVGKNSYIVGMNTIVSEKGQVTIPKPLRERLGIRPGQILDFSEEQGRLVATKVTPQDPVESLYGILKLGRPTDDAITSLRGKADAV